MCETIYRQVELQEKERQLDEERTKADELETQLNRLLLVVENSTGGFKDTIKSLLDYKDRAEAAEQRVRVLTEAATALLRHFYRHAQHRCEIDQEMAKLLKAAGVDWRIHPGETDGRAAAAQPDGAEGQS